MSWAGAASLAADSVSSRSSLLSSSLVEGVGSRAAEHWRVVPAPARLLKEGHERRRAVDELPSFVHLQHASVSH